MRPAMTMRNIKLTISYKGTAYGGWQQQKNARSIEEELKKAIFKTTGETVIVYGAGRTDAGVHALAQTANFRTDCRIPEERIAYALNARLPHDILVTESVEVPDDFHSRYNAVGKIYAYHLYLGPIPSPFYDEYCWHMPRPIDLTLMEAQCAYLLGTHDFRSFMASGSSVKTTVRRIESIDFEREGPWVTITFKGNGFLYNMVRIMVGTLVEIGMGKKRDMVSIVAARDRSCAGMTAPAKGLFLKQVLYK